MKAIILAGGLGTRLRSSVPDLPKAMAPVAGRPFLEYILDQFTGTSIDQVILSVGYRSEDIRSHFGDRYKQITLSYSVEASPLGTGGAIAHAMSADGGDTDYLVLNGDTFLGLDYEALLTWHKEQRNPVVMTLKTVPDVARYGSIVVDSGKVVAFAEKGNTGSGLINVGTYILNSGVFARYPLPDKFSLESDLLQAHIADLSPAAYTTDAYFIDIGIPEDFDRAQIELPQYSR